MSFKNTALVAAFVIGLCASVNASASLVSIGSGSLLGDATSTGFEGCALGALTSACTGLPLVGITAVGSSAATGDTISSGFSGNTVVLRGGSVVVAAPGEALDDLGNLGGFHVEVAGTITQFGFRLIDQVNMGIRVITSNGDTLTFTESSGFPNMDRYFQSNVAITSFDVLCNDGAGCNVNGWGLDNLLFAGITQSNNVPEPNSLALLGLAFAGIAISRRKSKHA